MMPFALKVRVSATSALAGAQIDKWPDNTGQTN